MLCLFLFFRKFPQMLFKPGVSDRNVDFVPTVVPGLVATNQQYGVAITIKSNNIRHGLPLC
jgi:hypothetical protein